MKVQIKKAIKAGNSSAVILPKTWLNKEVRVELIKKTSEAMLYDIFGILKKHLALKSIIGIYLVGSYARGEEDENSDIDILVITNNIDKEMISEGIYNILVVSYQLFHQKLDQNLFPVGQMLKEAKPLLNSDYIKDLKVKATQKNTKWYLDTTKEKLEIIQKYINQVKKVKTKTKTKIDNKTKIKNKTKIDNKTKIKTKINNKIKIKNKEGISDKIAYTLVLRIRTLEIIRKLIKNKNYLNKDFIKLIKEISKGENAYEGYLAIKNNLEDKKRISIEESERLYDYLKKDLVKVRAMVGKV